MWNRLNLSARIYMLLGALVLITVMGGVVMVWYTYRMERLLTDIIDRDSAAFETAEGLQNALVNQKGFVSYYFLDRDPDWLRQLGEYRQIFKTKLDRARSLVSSPIPRETLDRIEAEYELYITRKDRVIEYYKNNEMEKGRELHQQVRRHFFKLLELCDDFKSIFKTRMGDAKTRSQEQAENLRLIAGGGILLDCLLGVLLAFVLMKHILGPVRELAGDTGRDPAGGRPENEIKALSRRMRGLMEDVDFTHSELEKSREHLLQAEKMAMVGKLAAGMAHSIRNPFTSVKMRLFSLNRSLELTRTQQEDFQVISEEIRHVDNIVQNFLEFSRPPKLKIQAVTPSMVVDMTLQLLEHRLKSYDVRVGLVREGAPPTVGVDPEQLKEVLVNLMINACESMERDRCGNIEIREETESGPSGDMAVIRLRDDGPGIPESIRQKIFQPFFTTKEEGTGLGLSIAARIIQEHRGRLEVDSKEGEGTTFSIYLPVISGSDRTDPGGKTENRQPFASQGAAHEHHPDHRR